MTAWYGVPPPVRHIDTAGWLRIIRRLLPMAVLTYGGLILLVVLRLVEAPLRGPVRPLTPWITRWVCRGNLWLMGMGYGVRGRPMVARGAQVANHTGWLDIFTLNACQTIYFVAKSEVARWPGIGWLARATGTVFIARDPRQARAQQALFEDRLRWGHRMLFFPEGTSTDGLRVLPFKSTLFAGFYSHGLDHVMQIQPVTVIYRAPPGRDPRLYGWWGDMAFGPHFLATLSERRQGRVEVVFHDPVAVDAFPSRKELAAHCEAVIRAELAAALGISAVDEAAEGGAVSSSPARMP